MRDLEHLSSNDPPCSYLDLVARFFLSKGGPQIGTVVTLV